MNGEKNLQNFAIGGHLQIEGYLHHFHVARAAGAHRVIIRIVHVPAHVAGLHRSHAFHVVVHRFQTPEAAPSERRNFHTSTVTAAPPLDGFTATQEVL